MGGSYFMKDDVCNFELGKVYFLDPQALFCSNSIQEVEPDDLSGIHPILVVQAVDVERKTITFRSVK